MSDDILNNESDQSNQLPEGILQKSDVEGPFMAKVGTYTPRQIWIHQDDLPVSEGDKFRFVETDPDDRHPDWGSEQTAGKVDEIRDRLGSDLYFVTEESSYAATLSSNQEGDNVE